MRLLALVAVACSLSGCFLPAPANRTYGPNGKPAYTISCPGSMNGWGHCYERAGNLCGSSGYEILMQNGQATPFGMANGYANSSGGSFTGFSGAAVSRSMLVQCTGLPD